MRIRFFSFLVITLAMTSWAQAAHLPSVGRTYEIQEQSILEMIEARLQGMESTGELARRMGEAKARSVNSIENPPSLNLAVTTEPNVKYYDPSIVVSQDIYADNGKLIARKGTTINPLDYVPMNSQLLFFDGNSQEQVAYVLAQLAAVPYLKPVMTGGKPLSLMRTHQKRFYYDQKGVLVAKLGIETVPTLVRQEGKFLRIESVVIEETGQ